MDDKLAAVIAPRTWKIAPVTDLTRLEALPPAANARETKKAADTFASTGRNVFVHHVQSILQVRRELLLASGTTKKKYPKTAAQLWPLLQSEQVFFWHEAAREIRQCMKQGVLSPKACLIHAGRLSERQSYVWHAEVAVATYLYLPLPETVDDSHVTVMDCSSGYDKATYDSQLPLATFASPCLKDEDSMAASVPEEDCAANVVSKTAADVDEEVSINTPNHADLGDQLLDTLPDPFEYEQNMLYSHFAHYNYNDIVRAEGKHQTAMLRQLADRFDKTGKVMFYYYVVPRLCKQASPPSIGKTVTSKAAESWRFLSGIEKERWVSASANLKKTLGDGDVAGLESLRLDSLDPTVSGLHELAQKAVGGDGS